MSTMTKTSARSTENPHKKKSTPEGALIHAITVYAFENKISRRTK